MWVASSFLWIHSTHTSRDRMVLIKVTGKEFNNRFLFKTAQARPSMAFCSSKAL